MSVERTRRIENSGHDQPSYRAAHIWTSLSLGGALLATLSYLFAATVFSDAAVDAGGYRHWSDYWCELLTPTLVSGVPNRARPWAILATVLLPSSMVPVWWFMGRLFRRRSFDRLVQVTGTSAMVGAAFIPTTWHDLAIRVTAGLGFVAWGASLYALEWRRFWGVGVLELWAGLFTLLNYVLWTSHTFPHATPAVQKTALLLTLTWIVATNRALRRVPVN